MVDPETGTHVPEGEEGLMVIGFGERKTPRAFVTACDRFVHTDILRGARRPGGDEEEEDTRGRGETLPIDEELIDLLRWAGYEVSVGTSQTCCGALAAHDGLDRRTAREGHV